MLKRRHLLIYTLCRANLALFEVLHTRASFETRFLIQRFPLLFLFDAALLTEKVGCALRIISFVCPLPQYEEVVLRVTILHSVLVFQRFRKLNDARRARIIFIDVRGQVILRAPCVDRVELLDEGYIG